MDDPATRVNEAGDSVDDPEVARRTSEIRRDIAHTRDEMSETIEAIQNKLRPGNIAASATDRVKQAATERVRQMKHSAENAYSRMRSEASGHGMFGEGGDNRLPALLIGIGAAWWLMNRFSDSQDRSASWDRRFGVSGTDELGDTHGWREGAEHPGSEIASSARDITTRATEYTREAASQVRDTGRRAHSQLQRLTSENPLMVGAGALLLGSLVGLAIPETERENELLGEARDSMLERAQELARSAATRAQDSAAELAGEAASRIVGGTNE